MTDDEVLAKLRSPEDVKSYVWHLYDHWRSSPHVGGAGGASKLPLLLEEPGPLMVRAVEVAGKAGLTRQQLLALFDPLGDERKARGLEHLRASQRITETTENRPNRAGSPQAQTVFRADLSS